MKIECNCSDCLCPDHTFTLPPLTFAPQVLSILTNTMALLRRCRVNAALTIQLFSQLFHFINMWVFNRIVVDSHPNYCTR